MSSYKPSELERTLTSKGFRKDNKHHKMLFLFVDGLKTTVRTRISHGKKEYGDKLLGEMRKQVRLPKGKFMALIECSIMHAEYVAYLKQVGEL